MDKNAPAKYKILATMLEEYDKDAGDFGTVTPERCGIGKGAYAWSLRMLKANELITGPEWGKHEPNMDGVMITKTGIKAAVFWRDAEVIAR